jgi:hypothetical protein
MQPKLQVAKLISICSFCWYSVLHKHKTESLKHWQDVVDAKTFKRPLALMSISLVMVLSWNITPGRSALSFESLHRTSKTHPRGFS